MVRDWSTSATYTWTPTTFGAYALGIWVRNSGVSGDDPKSTASAPFPILPALVGTYAFTGSATNPNCTDPGDNGTVPFSGTLTISSQTGGSFGGTVAVPTCDDLGCHTDTVPLSGTVTGTGQVNGTLGNAEGRYTYSGSLSGTTLTLTFAGSWRDELGSCNLSGSLTAIKP